MKKIFAVALTVCLLAASFVCPVNAQKDGIGIVIDGVSQTYDVMPMILNERTMVPMRGIFESLDATVQWDKDTRTVTGTKGDITIVLQIGNVNVTKNGEPIEIDVPAQIINERTMVPARFVAESLECDVDWDKTTRTVIITSAAQTGMAKLASTLHRAVPTEFVKSNDLNDLLYFESGEGVDQEELYASIKEQGEVVCTTDEFMDGLKFVDFDYGSFEVVDVKGQPFDTAVRIECTTVPAKTADFIVRTEATPEKNPGDGVDGDDVMLLAFRFRVLEGGDNKEQGVVQIQIEHNTTYEKALFKKAYANKEWDVIYMPFTGVDDATAIGIRPGFCEQVIELGGVEIINLGPDFDIDSLPSSDNANWVELMPDAEWRKEANERIEKIRKGDFSVVVKDSNGNVIPDAEVEMDMFEHEFQFGSAVQHQIVDNDEYRAAMNRMFNSMVVEHQMNWAPWEEDRQLAIDRVNAAKEVGIKNFRGHNLVWQRALGSNGKTWLTPEYMFGEDVLTDRELFDEKVKTHIDDIAGYFKGQMDDWDVINEIFGNTLLEDAYDYSIYKQWFEWAREAAGEDCDLYYNEATGAHFQQGFFTILDKLVRYDVDFDAIGLQSHCENLQQPSEYMALYDKLEKYGKKLKTTEYSCNIEDLILQGNYTRDFMITMFAEEDMHGFLMWGFWDGNIYGGNGPMYTKDWQLKPAGQVYEDLVYNKWWTRDAKATTGADGKATIRGFYGDYDVTVSANGKTKTVSCAYHKGYDNVLEIVMD